MASSQRFHEAGCVFGAQDLTPDKWLIGITAGEVLFADVLLLPNGMSKVGANV